MKRLLYLGILCLSLYANTGQAQSSQAGGVFVLVDVSGNPINDPASTKITPNMRREAMEMVYALITNSVSADQRRQWELAASTDPLLERLFNGQGQGPMLQVGDWTMMMPFGDRETFRKFKVDKIQSFPADFDRVFNNQASFVYDQQNTFGEIARARASVAAAEEMKLKEYYEIVVEGLGEDTDSKPYTTEERNWLNTYNSAVQTQSLGRLKYRDANRQYTISITKVNVSQFKSPRTPNTSGSGTTTQPIIQQDNIEKPVLEIVSPKGSEGSPFEVSEGNVVVTWINPGGKPDASYTVSLTHDSDRSLNQRKQVQNSSRLSYAFSNLEPGTYTLTVSTPGARDRQYLRVKGGGGGGGFLLFLLLVALGVGGYFLYRYLSGRQSGGGGGAGAGDGSDIGFKANQANKPAGGGGSDAWGDPAGGSDDWGGSDGGGSDDWGGGSDDWGDSGGGGSDDWGGKTDTW